jgi:hypothetical protein
MSDFTCYVVDASCLCTHCLLVRYSGVSDAWEG